MKLRDFEFRELKPLAWAGLGVALWLGRTKPSEGLMDVVGEVMNYSSVELDGDISFIHSYLEKEVTLPSGRRGIAKVGLWDYNPSTLIAQHIGKSDSKKEDALVIKIMDGERQVGYIRDVRVNGYGSGDTLEGDLTYQEMVDMVLDGKPIRRPKLLDGTKEEVSFEA